MRNTQGVEGRGRRRCRRRQAMSSAAAVAAAMALLGGAGVGPVARAANDEATGRTDRIQLRGIDLVIGDVRIAAIDGDRVWYERPGHERGSVPLAAVEALAFAATPQLAAAERRALDGDPAGAAALLEPVTGGDGPAAEWAARRALQWLEATDPAAALQLAGERLLHDGDPRWLLRLRPLAGRSGSADAEVEAESEAEAQVEVDGASARAVLRQVRRWRQLTAEGGPATVHHVPVGAVPDVRRGLEELERRAERLVHAARLRGDHGEPAPAARPGRGRERPARSAAGAGGGGPAAHPPPLESEADVMAGLRAGRVAAVLDGLARPGAPNPSTFGPLTLAELGRAAEDAGRATVAAAAWLRCGILHPRSSQAGEAWEAAARVHELALSDPAAAARIRAHRAAMTDEEGGATR